MAQATDGNGWDIYGPLTLFDSDAETELEQATSDPLAFTAPRSDTFYLRVGEDLAGYSDLSDYAVLVDVCPGDVYEADNDAAGATEIAAGETQTHDMRDGSEDWISFAARAGE